MSTEPKSPISTIRQNNSFKSPSVVGNILESIFPVAQSTAIKRPDLAYNGTHTVLATSGNNATSPTCHSSQNESMQLLNLSNLKDLSGNLLSSGSRSHLYANAVAQGCLNEVKNKKENKLQSKEEIEAEHRAVCLNAAELRDLEEAFSDMEMHSIQTICLPIVESTDTRSAIASTGADTPDATAASSMPSLSESEVCIPPVSKIDSKNLTNQLLSPSKLESFELDDDENQENQPPALTDLSGKDDVIETENQSYGYGSDNVYYGRPLSTIFECKTRESLTSTTMSRMAIAFDPDASGQHRLSAEFDGVFTNASISDISKLESVADSSVSKIPRRLKSIPGVLCSTPLQVSLLTNRLDSAKPAVKQVEQTHEKTKLHEVVMPPTATNCRKSNQIIQDAPSIDNCSDQPKQNEVSENLVQHNETGADDELISCIHASDIEDLLDSKMAAKGEDKDNSLNLANRLDSAAVIRRRSLRRRSHVECLPIPTIKKPSMDELFYVKIIFMNNPCIVDCPVGESASLFVDYTICLVKKNPYENELSPPPVSGWQLFLQPSLSLTADCDVFELVSPSQPKGGCLATLDDDIPVTFTAEIKFTSSIAQEFSAMLCITASLVQQKEGEDMEVILVSSPMQTVQLTGRSQAPVVALATVTKPNPCKSPLVSTSRYIIWRGSSHNIATTRHFQLKHIMTGLGKIKLRILSGNDVFILLDDRGYPTSDPRFINLPPGLACTVNVAYKPTIPKLWHSGILSLEVESLKHICAKIYLLGYVGSGRLECCCCRRVDENTYWTSAFSSVPIAPRTTSSVPITELSPQKRSSIYMARVVVTNFGQRTVWVMARFATTTEHETSKTSEVDEPKEEASLNPIKDTVIIEPDRFVLAPSGSHVVNISILDQPKVAKILFYYGDEILRNQCRQSCPIDAARKTLKPAKSHRRLRTATVLGWTTGENDLESLRAEIKALENTIQPVRYDPWRFALYSELTECQVITMMIYPLVTEQQSNSFEQASLLLDEDYPTTSSLLLPNTTRESRNSSQQLLDTLSAVVLNASPVSPRLSINKGKWSKPRVGANVSKWISEAMLVEQSVNLPKIALKPSPILAFPACRIGLSKTTTLEVTLLPFDDFPPVVDSVSLTWQVLWNAAPLFKMNTHNYFTCLTGSGNEACESDNYICQQMRHARILVTFPVQADEETQSGSKFHIPFSFHPQTGCSPGLVQQDWMISFSLSPLEAREDYVGETQEFRITLVAEVLKELVLPSKPSLEVTQSKPPQQRSALRVIDLPVKLDCNQNQYEIQLLNNCRNAAMSVKLGKLGSPFSIIKPIFSRFWINARHSVRIRFGFQGVTGSGLSTGTLKIKWRLNGDLSLHHSEIPLTGVA